MSEQDIEKQINDKDLNAPRLTPEFIDSIPSTGSYYVFPGTQLTVCCLTLKNGFTVTGESACASPENFDEEIGRKIAHENARDKIWVLEGYLLKQKLYEEVTGTFLDRLLKEVFELEEKIKKLSTFIHSDKFYSLKPEQRILLTKQLEVMLSYGEILLKRVAAEKE
jgi:hypothetical protein